MLPDYTTEAGSGQGPRKDSNLRCLGVGQESWPLDHGIMQPRWELNPQAFIRLSTWPVCALGQPAPVSVARVGIEPTDNHQGLSLVALPVSVPCRRASPAVKDQASGVRDQADTADT